jgi:putative copper export protein
MAATTGQAHGTGRRTASRARLVLAVAGAVAPLVATLALAATGALSTSALVDAGSFTRRALPATTAARDGAATLTVGLLVLALLAMRDGDGDQLGPERVRVVRWAGAAAAVWAVSAAALVPLTFSDITGRPLGAPGFAAGLPAFVIDVELGRLLAGGAALVAVVAVTARRATMVTTTAVLTLMCAAALLLVAAGGHAASETAHDVAVNTMFVHLVGAAAWTGGLVGLVLLRTAGVDIAGVARRFSVLAGVCFVLVAASGVWRATVPIEALADLASPYGAILAGKVVLLVALGVAGAVHRRRTLPRLAADPRRWAPFLAVVLAEVVLIAAAVGLGAALSRTPLP